MILFKQISNFLSLAETALIPTTENKLFEAVLKDNLSKVRELLKCNVDLASVTTRSEFVTLGIPAYRGNIQMVKDLLSAGMPVNAKDKNGFTALTYAIDTNQKAIVKLLISYGAKVSMRIGPNQRTPLIQAVRSSQDYEMVKILIEAGANINAKDENGYPALSYAITYNLKEIVELLLQKGADINASVGISGRTPLIESIIDNKDIEIIKVLLEAEQIHY